MSEESLGEYVWKYYYWPEIIGNWCKKKLKKKKISGRLNDNFCKYKKVKPLWNCDTRIILANNEIKKPQ